MVNKLQSLGISYTSTHNFTELINAASFYLEDQYVDAITSLPMVSAIWPMRLTSLDRTPLSANSATNQTASSLTRPPRALLEHYYTGVNFAHQAPYNLTGRDIKVGVIDSGIDYHHPAFGSCYKTPGCRIQYGYDFVGDQFNGTNVLQPDDDPLDTCNGHGTTVTGILAGYDSGTDGEETYKGVAPDAILGIYRALGCSGLTNSVALIRAIEQAYVDGMQIINISVATASGWDAWSEAKVVQEFSNRGRIVVSAAGNSGLDNMWSVSSPSIALGCISVGDPPTLSVSTNPIDVAVFDNYLPNSVSWFSSWGPAAGNHLKPNLVAPGSKIYSPRPLNLGTYDLASGTSMSSPYVA
ncbi:peptidase S8/S53 domain-containing protein, partial [Dimargaris cristalligena]